MSYYFFTLCRNLEVVNVRKPSSQSIVLRQYDPSNYEKLNGLRAPSASTEQSKRSHAPFTGRCPGASGNL